MNYLSVTHFVCYILCELIHVGERNEGNLEMKASEKKKKHMGE